jgi:hypothetical protein
MASAVVLYAFDKDFPVIDGHVESGRLVKGKIEYEPGVFMDAVEVIDAFARAEEANVSVAVVQFDDGSYAPIPINELTNIEEAE